MDLLSRFLSHIRLTSPLLSNMLLSGDVSIDMSQSTGSPFYYAVSGAARMVVGDTVHHISAGEFLLLPRWPRHRTEVGQPVATQSILDIVADRGLPMWSREYGLDQPLAIRVGPPPYQASLLGGIFSMDETYAHFMLDGLPEVVRLRPEEGSVEPWILACLELVSTELAEPKAGFAAVASRALEILLIQTLRTWTLRKEQPPGFGRGYADAQLRRVLDTIHADPARRWKLEELAKLAGQSRSSFAQSFRQSMGETPFAYITRWRLHLAAERLVVSNEPIASVARSVGYTDAFSFARAFAARYRLAPGAFRRQAAERAETHTNSR
jgi:AraC-like DNA-binding protein